MRKLKAVAFVASIVAAIAPAGLTGVAVGAAPATFTKATYSSTLVGAGLASMYPVDVTSNSQYYFVMDPGRYRVVAVNRTTHNVDCSVGGMQGRGPGQFGDARALDFDSANNELFVADTASNRVEVFAFSAAACATNSPTAFTFSNQFGSGGSGNEQFSQVYGVAVDTVHNWVYAVDGAGRVEKSDLNGNFISAFGSGTLNQPRQAAVAPNGDVFVMSARNHECDVFNSSGTLLTHFGGPGKGNGQFTDDPRGVAVSADGTLAFATDSGGKRIETFSLTQSGGHYSGAAWKYTISSGTGAGTFVGPRGLTTTSDNHLMLTDEWGFNLHEFTFTATGASSTANLFGTPPPVPGVNSPRGVRVAANGKIYIDDYWNQRIEYMNPDGNGATAFGFRGTRTQAGAINFAWDAALQSGTGNVFVANRESQQVEVFGPTGTYITSWGVRGTANGQFTFPQGIAFGPDGTLYVDDSGNGRVERFTINSAGNGTWMATYGQNGTSGAGFLNMPTGIAVASNGTIWIADTLNSSIQSRTSAGVWTLFHTPIGGTKFHVPWGVGLAPDGNIWVSDTGNNRIVAMDASGQQVFSETGSQMGVPGNPIIPFAMAFDATNHVYLSDIWNNRVLVLTAS